MVIKVKNHRILAFITYTIVAGLWFAIPYSLLGMMIGVALPKLLVWQMLLLGNISMYGYAICEGFIERIMVTTNEKILNRQ